MKDEEKEVKREEIQLASRASVTFVKLLAIGQYQLSGQKHAGERWLDNNSFYTELLEWIMQNAD